MPKSITPTNKANWATKETSSAPELKTTGISTEAAAEPENNNESKNANISHPYKKDSYNYYSERISLVKQS